MIKDFSDALGIKPDIIYAILGLALVAIVFSLNEKAGWILGGLAILAIITSK